MIQGGDYHEMKKRIVELEEKVDMTENKLRQTQFDLEGKIAGVCVCVCVCVCVRARVRELIIFSFYRATACYRGYD